MCDVCEREKGDLAIALERFLDGDFGVSFYQDRGGWEELYIINTKTGEKFKLTADGDEGGYFHWTPPKAEPEIDLNDLTIASIMGGAKLVTHDHELSLRITKAIVANLNAIKKPKKAE